MAINQVQSIGSINALNCAIEGKIATLCDAAKERSDDRRERQRERQALMPG